MKARKNISPLSMEIINQFPSVSIISHLQERLDERGLSLLELSKYTGIRYATLHDFKTGKKQAINIQHLLAIMVALRLNSFDDLFELDFEDVDEHDTYRMEAEDYANNGIPDDIYKRIREMK
jgi:DNA-binding Xre family transcriptional regulator